LLIRRSKRSGSVEQGATRGGAMSNKE